VAAVAWLVLARLRYRPLRWLLVTVGLAAATVVPVLATNSASLVAGQSLAYGLDKLDPALRTLAVSRTGVRKDQQSYQALDAQVRAALTELSDRPALAQVLYRRLADPTGTDFFLGGADHLAGAIQLTQGRLPAPCTQQDCEVVVIGDGTPKLDPALHLQIVGRAVRTDPSLLSGTFGSQGAPLLVGNGVLAVADLDALSEFQRSYGWALPVDLKKIQQLGVDGYLARSHEVALDLSVTGTVLTAPDDVLTQQSQLAQRSTRRFGLLAGAAIALLLGFAVLGAIGLRRDHAAVRELLRRRGARGWQRTLLSAFTAAVPVTVGTLLGLAIGAAIAAWRADSAGVPAATAARHAVVGSLPLVAIGWALGLALVTLTLNWRTDTAGRTAWRIVDGLAIGGLVAAALAVSRGTVSAGGLDTGTDPILLALPILTVICGGLLLARLWPLAARAVAAVLPAGALGTRLGLLGAVRRPLRPVATVAFLGAATATLVFAGGYRATLDQGAADQAAFGVPLAARVSVGQQLLRPLNVASLDQFAATAPGAVAYAVLRGSASVQVNAAESDTVSLLGLDPAALTQMDGWSRLVGTGSAAGSRSALDRAVITDRFTPTDGIEVPAGTTGLRIPVTGDLDPLTFDAVLRLSNGLDAPITLTRNGNEFTGQLPALTAPARLFAITFAEDADYATHHQHNIGEGTSTDVAVVRGAVRMAPIEFSPVPAETGWRDWGSAGAAVSATAQAMDVTYALTGSRIVLRSGFARPHPPVPVLADAETAKLARGGVIQLNIDPTTAIPGKVVAVLPRFPTMERRFVVADLPALSDALEGLQPGTGIATEVWIAAPPSQQATLASALGHAPFTSLRVQLQAADRAYLRSDPLASGAGKLLRDNAFLGLVIALLAIGLLVVAERRDESAELYAWECDGLPPSTLRRVLFARAASVIAVAVPGGLGLGLLLSTVTTKLVQVTAGGTTPQPPLALALGLSQLGLILGAAVVIGLLAAAVAAGSALREPLPQQPQVAS
jgi:hypothetical protein